MEFIEADPLPIQCQCCMELDCDECDYLGLRWRLTKESQRLLSQAIEEKKRLTKEKREQIRKQRRRYQNDTARDT